MSKKNLTKADKLAIISLIISFIGAVLNMFIIGIPLSIAALSG